MTTRGFYCSSERKVKHVELYILNFISSGHPSLSKASEAQAQISLLIPLMVLLH